MKTFLRAVLAVSLLLPATAAAQAAEHPQIPERDRIRLAEAFRLAEEVGEKLWPGWKSAPFAVLLITPEHEFLVRHPQPSEDFTRLGRDELLGSDVYFRKRTFFTGFEATFPAVGGVSTVVIGQAENTNSRTSTRWVLTVLHEHFHQWQESQAGYYAEVNALDLARGDQSGMWMLNFPFPYESAEANAAITEMSHALKAAIAAEGAAFAEAVARYRKAQERLEHVVPADAARYLAFQLWKEGVARWTEYRLAQLAADHQPSPAFRALPDFVSFAETGERILARIQRDLETPRMGERKREVVYSLGAAVALALDRAAPGWQQRYQKEKFRLERCFATAAP
jgi:hypothetical protein